MPKRIVFCADGTWNHPQSSVETLDADTNVYKMFKALAITSSQLTFYDDGVGCDGTAIEKLVGGAFGAGLFQKIKDGYTAIAHVYEQGDEIFIFGFSRGAYTARSLSGMISICGLPTSGFDQQLVDTAFDAYRNKDERQVLLASLGKYKLFNAKITMLGVWDTVGSLGIPAIFGGVSPLLYGFLDTGLHEDVLNAYHALAIDEKRGEFPPTLWTSVPGAGQTIKQVWFTGVHCDVGGGYNETGLSDITLSWMLDEAQSLGLELLDTVASRYKSIEAKHSLDTKHESWNPLWLFPKHRSIDPNSSIANSVEIRTGYDPNYRPPNLSLQQNGTLGNTYDPVQVVTPALALAAGAK